jgi:hypothetical protein
MHHPCPQVVNLCFGDIITHLKHLLVVKKIETFFYKLFYVRIDRNEHLEVNMQETALRC